MLVSFQVRRGVISDRNGKEIEKNFDVMYLVHNHGVDVVVVVVDIAVVVNYNVVIMVEIDVSVVALVLF